MAKTNYALKLAIECPSCGHRNSWFRFLRNCPDGHVRVVCAGCRRELESDRKVGGRFALGTLTFLGVIGVVMAVFNTRFHAPPVVALSLLVFSFFGAGLAGNLIVINTAQFRTVALPAGDGPKGLEIGLTYAGAICPQCRAPVGVLSMFTAKRGLGLGCKKCGAPLQFCANRIHVIYASMILWFSLFLGVARFIAPAFYPWARTAMLLAVVMTQPLIMWKLLVVFSTVDMRESSESENETTAP